MNDQERLRTFLDRMRSLEGLDEERFQRLTVELGRPAGRFGYDEEGRLRVALFDAKSYDIESFERSNNGRFTLDPIEASLNQATAPAAEGHKIVCIFVNDTCDAAVVKALAGLGVELVALRCAGFNNVDLAACREHGLSVVRVPEYSPYAVAEHTVGPSRDADDPAGGAPSDGGRPVDWEKSGAVRYDLNQVLSATFGDRGELLSPSP